MTWTAQGAWNGSTNGSPTSTNIGIGNLLIVEVINFSNSTVWATGLTGGGATWVQAGVKLSGTNTAQTAAVFLGTITATGAQTATITWSGTTPANFGSSSHEFSTSVGSWTFITQGNLDSTGTANWPSLNSAAGDLYFGYCGDAATATQGSTSGYIYNQSADGAGNGAAYNLNCPGGATFPVWGDSGQQFGIAVLIREGTGTAAGAPGPARPGKTWLRRFHHRQVPAAPVTVPPVLAAVPAPPQLPPVPRRVPQRARLGRAGLCAAGVAVAFTVPAPGAHRPPAPQPRPASRAHTGPQGLPGGGIASQVVTPRGAPSRPQPFVFRSPPPRRARTGRAGLPGAGIASAIVTPLGSPPSPAWRLPIPRRVPDRAQAGPAGRNAAGIASQIVTPLGTPGPAWRPQPRRPAPERALWRAGAGPQPAAVTTVTAYQHAPPPPRSPAPRRALWRGYGSPVVTPLGTPTARRPVFIAPGRRSRATVGHGQVAGGISGPQAVAPIAPQAYQHPQPLPRRPAPRRAVWRGLAVPAPRTAPGPAWRAQPRSPAPRRALWHGGTGTPPVTAAAVTRMPRQPRSSAPRRAVWRGLASRIVTPLGIPSRKPPPPANTPRKRQRALWRRGAGPQPPPPTGLLAGTTAGPPASRWQAALPAARWQPRPAASRWQAALPVPRYDAGNPAARWQAGPPVKGRYSVRVVTGSVEYIQFPVAGPPGVDVTTFPVEVAVVTEAHGEPGPSDPAWTTGSWLGGLASLLIDETVLGNGDYVVYGRLTATPEKPVVRSGRVRLGPAA